MNQEQIDRAVRIGTRIVGAVLVVGIAWLTIWAIRNRIEHPDQYDGNYDPEMERCVDHQMDEGLDTEGAIYACGG